MALFRRKPVDRPVTSVTAAAQRVELTAEKQHEQSFRRVEDWQIRAWEFYDSIGEAGYAANYMGNAIGRLRAFGGVRPDPQGDIEPLEDEPDEDADYTPDEAAAVTDALERLQSPTGGRSDLQRRLGINLFVPGDCFLIGEADSGGEECWEIYSSEQIRIDRETKRTVRGSDGQQHTVPLITVTAPGQSTGGRELPPEASAYRVWRPHPRYRQWPDSPFRRAMTILEELDVATRAIMGGLRSRLNGPGAWFLPSSVLQAGAIQTPNLDGDDQAKRSKGFVRDLVETTSTAIQDPATAAARIPFVAGIRDDLWEKLDASKQLFTWDRSIDEQMAATRGELIVRFATAIDLPPEIITGKAEANRWTAWNIDEDTYRAHIQPFAETIFEALTVSYLTPTLQTMGVERPERFVIGFDNTELVADPDRSARSKDAHESYLISDQVRRSEMGYTDEDAPDDDEITRRVWIDAAKMGRTPVPGPVPDTENEVGPPPEPDTTPMEEPRQPPEPVASLVASAKDRALSKLGSQLHTIDASLLAETHSRADQTMRRALERANARLKTLALRDKQLRELVKDLSNESLQIGPLLGETLIVRLAESDDSAGLFAGAFGGYLDWWDVRTGRAQDQATNDIATAGDLEDAALAEHVAALDDDRTAARGLLEAALLTTAASLLIRPDELASRPGEQTGDLVGPGIVRGAAARAGGGGENAMSLTSGSRFERILGDAYIDVDGWTWDYGDPAARGRPFPPHVDLDGMFFPQWSSELLEVGEDAAWLRDTGTMRYVPGDHSGCRCLATPTLRRVPRSSRLAGRDRVTQGDRP